MRRGTKNLITAFFAGAYITIYETFYSSSYYDPSGCLLCNEKAENEGWGRKNL